MSIHGRKRRIIVAAVVVLIVSVVLPSVFRNRLSGTTIVGRWQGCTLQPLGIDRHKTAARVPLTLTFRADGVVSRGGNGTDADYMVCDNALVIYNIRSSTAAHYPVLMNARIVGDTLTLSAGGVVTVLRRAQ